MHHVSERKCTTDWCSVDCEFWDQLLCTNVHNMGTDLARRNIDRRNVRRDLSTLAEEMRTVLCQSWVTAVDYETAASTVMLACAQSRLIDCSASKSTVTRKRVS